MLLAMSPTDKKSGPAPQELQSRVRIAVRGQADLEERFAENLSDGGLFVRHDTPPGVGTEVLVEFVLPDGSCLSRIAAKVVHARPATTPGERGAGMGLRFIELDALAREVQAKLDATRPTPELPAARGTDSIAAMPRAPLIGADGPVVGIDLGTVNSCVAYVKDGRPTVLTSSEGYQIIPSVVFIAPDGKPVVGHRAVERMILNPGRAIYGSKRFLGRPFASKEVRTLGHFFSYELVATAKGGVAAKVDGAIVPLEEVAGSILKALRELTERELGRTVKRAVVTVPAYFGETQRQAVRDAGRIAGLYVERILNEPTAAAVAYGWGRDVLGTILVYDLGGGTFDVSVLRIDGERVEVLATDGDPFLGGADFDDRITEYVLTHFERQTGVSLRKDMVAVQRVRFSAELCKRQLSEAPVTEMHLPFIGQGKSGPLELRMKLDRDTLEALTRDLVDRTFEFMQQVLDRAKISSSQLDDVLLVGGQTRMPLVRQRLAERFGRKPSASVHPEEAVGLGAAIVANKVQEKKPLELIDILPASLRVGSPDGKAPVLLPRGARLPAEAELFVHPDPVSSEYRVSFYRGESLVMEGNTLVGTVRMVAGAALVMSNTKAHVRVEINAEGILTASLRHPMTDTVQEAELSLLTKL
jgi:molecular chaperone DnaK